MDNFILLQRYVLAEDIRKSMYRLLELSVRLNKKYYKKTTLQDTDTELEVLRTFIRLSVDKEMKYLSIKKYENWSKMLNEIGRIIGELR